MQLEDLFHTHLPSTQEASHIAILVALMIQENQYVYVFLLTEQQREKEVIRHLMQFFPECSMLGPICKGADKIAIEWLRQFGRVFKEACYDNITIVVEKEEKEAEKGQAALTYENQQLSMDGSAVLYLGQELFAMTRHSQLGSDFYGVHYHDEFTIHIGNQYIDAAMRGFCIDDTEQDGMHYLAYCAESAYQLKHTMAKKISITDIRQPFQLMEFIVKSADADIAVEIQNYDKQKVGRNFIGVRLIENIVLEQEEELYIGDVTITRAIQMQGELPEEFQLSNEYGAYMWVKVTAGTFYLAYEKAREQLECAAGILNLLIKNDSVYPFYGKSLQLSGWHLPFHSNIVYVNPGIYLENCDTAECLYYGGEENSKNIIRPEQMVRDYLEEDNELDEMFNMFADGNKHQSFLLMLRWFEAGCMADILDEKIIYLDMALEFAMNGEQGISFLAARNVEEETSRHLIEKLKQGVQEALPDTKQQKEIMQQLENTLIRNTNFMSKLERFIEQEHLQITKSELELIQKMRRKRNAIAHGKKNVKFSKRETEKVTGIISNILLAKVYKVVRESECN